MSLLFSVMAKLQNILQWQINLLEVLADDILLVAVWSTARLFPVCRCWVKLVNDSDKVIIRLWPSYLNTMLSNGEKDIQLTGPTVELLIEHKIRSVHPLNGSESAGLKAMVAGGKSANF